VKDYRSYSFWLDDVPDPLEPRAPLPGPRDVDVAIVGAGYTGLWTAYYLAKADPHLRIAIIEKEVAGFGASGRNGGWCSPFNAELDSGGLLKRVGRERARAAGLALIETVDEVGRVVADEGIDAAFHKGGYLGVVTTPPQEPRLRAALDQMRKLGFGEEHFTWLSGEEIRARIRLRSCLAGVSSPDCASIHPARLARGLAATVERAGVTIYEQTSALAIRPHAVETPAGVVRADVVVRATEGYTASLRGSAREMAPIYTFVIATEPLGAPFWDEVGWGGRETFLDGRRAIFYALRTRDDRIVIGGLRYPYHFRSRIADRFDRDQRCFAGLQRLLVELLPAAAGIAVTHRWGGLVGVPRDFATGIGLDRAGGLAWAGGYIGDGVATSNLAGRTLRDLILDRPSDLTRLPWVGHRSRPWEPEPLRWIAGRATDGLMSLADRREARTGRPARVSGTLADLLGA
jgi:glycine/D-amino acid oxidase-like deaminating enzyme